MPALALGSEVYVNLFSELFDPGSVSVHNAVTNAKLGTVPIVYSGNSLSFDLPADLLGGGLVNYGIVVGSLVEATDRAPNGTTPARSVPEPGGFVLAVVGVLICAPCARRLRTPGGMPRIVVRLEPAGQ